MVSISNKSFIQSEALEVVKGKSKKFSIEIYENDGKNGILSTGDPDLSTELFSLYNCNQEIIEANAIIYQDTAVKTSFTDPDGNTGYKLHYIVDTSVLDSGKYLAVFEYLFNTATEGDYTLVRFDLVDLGCGDF